MRIIIALLLALSLFGCGASDAVLDAMETTTKKLQPVVKGWRLLCQTGRGCLEGAGEESAELERICELGWENLQLIQKLQETAIRAAGGTPCLNGCNQ